MTLAFIGGFIGLLAGGPVGLLVGGVIGYLASKALQRTIVGGLRVAQTELMGSVFAVMGAYTRRNQDR